MGSRHAWLFPAASFVLLPLAFLTSYAIAVSKNHVAAIWPYISDTGALPPESCIFGQLLNMSAGFMMVSLYLRHRQIMAYFGRALSERPYFVLSSRISLAVGFVATCGLMVVANFQEQNLVSVHFVGAFTAFSLGLVYGWYQMVISFLSPRTLTPRWLCIFRLIICICGAVFFVGMFAVNMNGQNFEFQSYRNITTTPNNWPTIHRLMPGDKGYEILLVTTISEWCLGSCLALFFLTLAFDLKGSKLRAVKLELSKRIEFNIHVANGKSNWNIMQRSQDELQRETIPVRRDTLTSGLSENYQKQDAITNDGDNHDHSEELNRY